MLLDLYSFTFVTRQIRLGLSWWLSGAAHSVCFAWTVTGMGLGAYPRSGWIIYVKIISVCFEINFLDRREGWMVSSIIYEQWWHLCHQAGSPLKQCQSKTNSCCQWRDHTRGCEEETIKATQIPAVSIPPDTFELRWLSGLWRDDYRKCWVLCYVTTFVHNCVHTVVTDRFRFSSVVFCIFIVTGSVCLCHDIFFCVFV